MKKKLLEQIEVIYEDPDLIVVEKARGVITYPVEENQHGSAIQLIRRYWRAQQRNERYLYLLHRLDKDTSGLLIFAKTSLARESLRKQFQGHTILREYLAVTDGIPQKNHGKIKTLLGRDARGKRAVSVRGRLALTDFEVVSTNPKRRRALLRCRLHTGRTHQVRIHLAHIGAPVVGDRLYSRGSPSPLALHACALGFLHPRTHAPVLLRTSLPPELRALLR